MQIWGYYEKDLLKGSFIQYVHKIFRKANISYLLIRTRPYPYQGVRNVSFSGNFPYVLNECSQIDMEKLING